MTVRAGQTLLHYRLVDRLGVRGMGEVWNAVDTTLDRQVAVSADSCSSFRGKAVGDVLT